MQNISCSKINKPYFIFIILIMLVLPALSAVIDLNVNTEKLLLINLICKWFVFWAVGWRLFIAGLRQVINPAFTAESIFHIKDNAGFVIVKELGFANICFGAAGIISLLVPQWRTAAAFSGGLYMGIAGLNHILKKPESANEWIALVSDIFIFLLMSLCIFFHKRNF